MAWSEHGPDWTDIALFARELTGISRGVAKVEISWPDSLYGGHCYIQVTHRYPQLRAPAEQSADKVYAEYPNKRHRSIEATIFRLFQDLDREYLPTYEQDRFPTEEA